MEAQASLPIQRFLVGLNEAGNQSCLEADLRMQRSILDLKLEDEMSKKKLSRREFLRLTALAAGSTAFSRFGTISARSTAEGEIILEVRATEPEYENAERQIWDIYEGLNPGVKIEMFSAGQEDIAAYEAKIAGGWLPDITQVRQKEEVTRDNYSLFMDLSTIDFPWFDRWQWDVENKWSDLFDLPGPRALDPFAGVVSSFVYHKDIVDETGWDPQTQVKTLEDFYKFIDDLTKYAEENPDLDYGWDRGWINGFMYLRHMNMVPVAFPDGGRDRQADCWFGRAKFNDPESPFRHTLEFDKEMLAKGYNAQNWWTREWKTDMEASFIAKKSAMLLHGPWVWDKVLASDPDAQLQGFPFPSVDGENTIVHMSSPGFNSGFSLLEGVQEKEYWDQIKDAYFWWFSPDVVKMRAEVLGRDVLYDLDEPLELTGPQWKGLLQYVGGDLWPDAVMDLGPWGEIETLPYRIGGSPGPWDRGGGSFNSTYVDAIQGNITIQEALDAAQANWEASFEVDSNGELVIPG